MKSNLWSIKQVKKTKTSVLLFVYDIISYILVSSFFLIFYKGIGHLNSGELLFLYGVFFLPVFAFRLIFGIYKQIWRYGGVQSYILLLLADSCAFVFISCYEIIADLFTFLPNIQITFVAMVSICACNLLVALAMRLLYRYAYKNGDNGNIYRRIASTALKILSFGKVKPNKYVDSAKIKIAVLGAGSTGMELVSNIVSNPTSPYHPVCFIDRDPNKIGRITYDMPIYDSNREDIINLLNGLGVQTIVIAISELSAEARSSIYTFYKEKGFSVKKFDSNPISGANKKAIREFEIDELLFRRVSSVIDDKYTGYYNDKIVLITGGGGSIGSELCRQIAAMKPKKLIILDVYENGAYEIQQELRIKYPQDNNVCVEIVSVCNSSGLERVFAEHRPDIVINAAAHKHVPLMEKNCIEAIENNIFGTLNTLQACIKYKVQRMIMVSTDKAVNPTNVMGATKRFCEMMVMAYAAVSETTTFNCTRFGNVLGSAGSVIPLFKKQIASGGPITLTDKRIIRYFMTIPEASSLVLTSGALAKNGELFVLDMGKPISIYDLAKNMIMLSGYEPDTDIKIIETGLRPGEKLYEELLVKTEELDKTENELIYIEHDTPITMEQLQTYLDQLTHAVKSGDDDMARMVLKQVVPTFHSPEEINAQGIKY